MKTLTWLSWHLWYFWQPRPRELRAYLNRAARLRPPWWKFSPGAWHNDDNKQWEIWFDNESYHSEKGTLTCWVSIGRESGNIVGLTINDKSLEKVKDE